MTFELVNPLTLRPMSVARLAAGDVVPVEVRALVPTTAPITVLLAPSPTEGNVCVVTDDTGTAGTNAITVSGNGNTIDGAATSTINADGDSATFAFDGAEWKTLITKRVVGSSAGFELLQGDNPPPPPTGLLFSDEGVPQGTATAVDVVGAGASVAVAAGVATLTASGVNTGIGCKAFQSVAQSLVNGINTPIALQSESFDDAAMHDNAVDNSRITVPAAQGGRYVAIAQLGFAVNGAGARSVAIFRNGVTLLSVTNDATNGLFVGKFIPALARPDQSPWVAWDQTAGAWPAVGAAGLRPLVGFAAYLTGSDLQYANSPLQALSANLGIVLGAKGAANADYSATIRQIRVDYYL